MTAITSKIYLDGNEYYYERNSYKEHPSKVFSESFSVTTALLRQEGGMNPTAWDMNVICLTVTELNNLSGSFIKTSSDSRLAFSGQRLDAHMVYFDKMEVESINRKRTMFRCPVRLSAAKVGQ